jgi:hypothetical protein
MKRNYLLLLFVAFISINTSAITYTSSQNGNWMNFTTWSPMGIPIPGDIIVINHTVTLDTSFAYTSGSILVSASGSLLQDIPVRDVWLNGPNAAFTSNGTVNIRYLLLSDGSYTNSGNFNVKSVANYITADNTGTGVMIGVDSLYNDGTFNNDGQINIMTFYNDNTINNYGIIRGLAGGIGDNVDSMYNAGTFINNVGATVRADSCTNSNVLTNNGDAIFVYYTNIGTCTNNGQLETTWVTNDGTFTNSGIMAGFEMTNAGTYNNQVGALLDLTGSLLNSAGPSTFTAVMDNNGQLNIGDSYYNFDNVTGSATGSIVVQDTSYNSGIMSGSFDFCDATPPPTSPYIDFNLGTVDPAITYCTVGINTNEISSNILIYPNPTNGIISIETDENVSVEIYNVLGEKVISITNHKIDLSTFENGMYFVLLKDEIGEIIKHEKIIKQ